MEFRCRSALTLAALLLLSGQRVAAERTPVPAAPAPTTLNGESSSDTFGFSVASAGDVNGDGLADVIVGAPGHSSGTGRAYVFLGSASGPSTPAATTLTGETTGSAFGRSVAGAGDVNGDGFGDVLVGADGYSTLTGRAYVFLGSASGLGTTPALTLTGEASGDAVGGSGAGGGYSTGAGSAAVVGGAPAHASNTGRTFVYHGGATGIGTPAATILDGETTGSFFGASVAGAGDVNGNGYADVVIGAYGHGGGTGRAYVYGGGAGGVGTTAAATLTGEAAGNQFGASVAGPGDVDGDGYADLVVGAPGYSTDTGRAYVHHGSAAGVGTSASTTLTGEATGNLFGGAVSPAGDVNGDGFADIIVGARGYSGSIGRAYVHRGGGSGVNTSPATTLTGEAAGDEFGRGASAAGDVNGDGYADLIVGAPAHDASTGRAYAHYGNSAQLGTSAAPTLTGEATSSNFGVSVASAGDVNGDGYADVIVGAYGYSNSTGRAFVFLGSASGLGTSPATTLTGETSGDYFGESVAGAGDVDGDGYADVIVGANGYNLGTGRAYVFLGSASGLSSTPSTTLTGEGTGHRFGYSVAGVGDVNRDGYADVAIGAHAYSLNTGRAYVYLGSAGGLSPTPSTTLTGEATGSRFGYSVAGAGDVNKDGAGDVVIGARGYSASTGRAYVFLGSPGGLVSTAATTLTGEAAGNRFGSAVAHAGDVNGDGFADVVIGADLYSSGTGRAYVFLGDGSGLVAPAASTLTGEATNHLFGQSVSGAGDVNGDGFADVAVGATGYGSVAGRAYVYLGSASGLVTPATATPTGEAVNNYFGVSVAGAGDVNGDGYADVVAGANGYSSYTGRAYVYAGNAAAGVPLLPRMRRSDDTAPIARLGSSDSSNNFRLLALGRTPFGRGKVKLEREVKPLLEVFDGAGLARTATWQDTGTAGVTLNAIAAGLVAKTPHHWRVRVVYDPATSPAWTGTSRWVTQPWGGWNETHLRTKSDGSPNAVPIATSVTIDGTLQVGQVLTGVYTYWDVDGDFQGGSTYRWLRGGSAIAGATAKTYTVVPADGDQTLTFEVTPGAATGLSPGIPVVSPGVLVQNFAPTAMNVTIGGVPRVGQVLTGGYTYADVDGDVEGASIFVWRRNGAIIPGVSALAYTPVTADSGQTLTFEVTPVAATGRSPGTTASSAGILVQNSPPTATNVAITGTAQVGQVLTGSYTYGDVDGDAEGVSTFRWLRGGTPIPGATTTTYTTVSADDGTTLTFEVTPVAAAGASPGTPALSPAFPIGAAAPTVSITSPTSDPSATATSPFLTVGGTATGGNPISSVAWATDRAFSGDGTLSDVAADTAGDARGFSAVVPLVAGVNVITVTATDSTGATATDTLTVDVSSFVYYFAEGATGPFFDLDLALANPSAVDAPVSIQYLKEDGSTVPQVLTLSAGSRQTIRVDDLPGLAGTAVSSVVTSTSALPLAVERTMTWDTSAYGAHTEKATPGAQATWYFAEGSEQGFFDTYLLLANPQSTANRATVQFLVEGGSPVTKVYDLLPTSRTNVFAEAVTDTAGTKVLLDKAFGIVVTFDQPGVAERAMYFGTAPFWDGGHESAGVNAPSKSWFHAEGATGSFFDTFILLSNPSSTTATVTLRFLLDSGATVTKTKTVPANARLTVIVEGEDPLLANAAMATEVTSDVPIVSERAMYWAQYPNWYEAHNAFGVTAIGKKWALGEGRVGGTNGYETYILLANPGTATATVTVTYLREGGLPPIMRTHTVNPASRYNVVPAADGLSNERFGVLIEATTPIAVERAVYGNSTTQPGRFWASGTNATGTPIP